MDLGVGNVVVDGDRGEEEEGKGDLDVLECGAQLREQDLWTSGGVGEFLEDRLKVEEGGETEGFVYFALYCSGVESPNLERRAEGV